MGKGLLVAIIMAIAVATCSYRNRDTNLAVKPAASAKVVLTEHDMDVRRAAVSRLMGTGQLANVHWADNGDLIIAAQDNGKTWQPVADNACTWVRGQGYAQKFSVQVLEAAALRNKRWKSLAHARCA